MADRDTRGTTPPTPYPRRAEDHGGRPVAPRNPSLYVITRPEHGLHYDLRLDFGELSVCWAIPQRPSHTPGDKLLAIRTTESTLGAVWDTGVVAGLGTLSPTRALDEGRLTFRLDGDRLHGAFVLVRAYRSSEQEQWLLITKETDSTDHVAAVGAPGEEPW
ncbi:DNA polymerase ligase N-terminal domain-containing protein [Saccharomonospora sp. NB11]|uniref:DNA polymerase ligase N-terminal domain-containing protein n=1 Tax=Saccharomonospora sp. NB11 TaxID=1642298 RepID=UPI001E5D5BC7|nr:DNA polymerase ligase N-terminal domain-containing protein [Saccharomonospora sp. NB11]